MRIDPHQQEISPVLLEPPPKGAGLSPAFERNRLAMLKRVRKNLTGLPGDFAALETDHQFVIAGASREEPALQPVRQWIARLSLATLLVGCAEAPTSPAPVAYATVVAFADPLNGKYDTIIALYDKPVDSQVPANRVGTVHAGEQVGVMEQRADGNVRIRTDIMEEGWTRIEALKDKNTP